MAPDKFNRPHVVARISGSGTGSIGDRVKDSNGTVWEIVSAFTARGTGDRRASLLPGGVIDEY
jgi:hypothetical protein